jgi:hypothetical protein
MPRIITLAEIKAQEQARIAQATQRAAGTRTNADQGTMAGDITAGTEDVVATTQDWDRKNFATVVPAKHLPQQKTIRLVRDASGRETILPG